MDWGRSNIGIDIKFPFENESMRISVWQMFMLFDIDNYCQTLIELLIGLELLETKLTI